MPSLNPIGDAFVKAEAQMRADLEPIIAKGGREGACAQMNLELVGGFCRAVRAATDINVPPEIIANWLTGAIANIAVSFHHSFVPSMDDDDYTVAMLNATFAEIRNRFETDVPAGRYANIPVEQTQVGTS